MYSARTDSFKRMLGCRVMGALSSALAVSQPVGAEAQFPPEGLIDVAILAARANRPLQLEVARRPSYLSSLVLLKPVNVEAHRRCVGERPPELAAGHNYKDGIVRSGAEEAQIGERTVRSFLGPQNVILSEATEERNNLPGG